MNEKEISELRRRLRPDRQNITAVCGCYVSDKGEIISSFTQSLGLMPEDESEKYMNIFRRVLSGSLRKNLIDISFRTAQVADSEEHRILTALKDTALGDEDARQAFYTRVMEGLRMDSNYVILLAHDSYDVPYRGKDGLRNDDAGSGMFSYVLCAVCPVKMTKPELRYVAAESVFHNRGVDFIVSPPELGFLFPAFDDRATNLYGALYYTKSAADSHTDFVDVVFRTEVPMPAEEQKETFRTLLSDALDEECRYEVVEAVHEQLTNRIEAHKTDKEIPLTVTREDVQEVLESCGVSEPRRAAFHVRYDSAFGTDTGLSPRNVIDAGQFEIRTPDVVIKVNPERRDLVETRVIGGKPYILVSAEDGVEVNGVNICLEKG
ncbi:MAG: DUF4317 domain-containing protein [Oscillospiraceae bacterium]|nr:DUF4317 domain-containing protein [Oscillospiraceae bacterium]